MNHYDFAQGGRGWTLLVYQHLNIRLRPVELRFYGKARFIQCASRKIARNCGEMWIAKKRSKRLQDLSLNKALA
jgi:hypothetical protein